jgi:acylphosphatase
VSAQLTRLVRVGGLVQGVGYRYATVRRARELGVVGWVRNRHDGTVEALVQGPTANVAALIDWMRCGPPGAGVTRLDERDGPAEPLFKSFDQWPSA